MLSFMILFSTWCYFALAGKPQRSYQLADGRSMQTADHVFELAADPQRRARIGECCRSDRNCARAGHQKLRGVFAAQYASQANHRNMYRLRRLIDQSQCYRLDGRPRKTAEP